MVILLVYLCLLKVCPPLWGVEEQYRRSLGWTEVILALPVCQFRQYLKHQQT